jgi:Phytanoyl-CoA dioxygenase (PhyH)
MFPSLLADPSRQAALEREGWATLPSIGGALSTLRTICDRTQAQLVSDPLWKGRGYYELMHSMAIDARRAAQAQLEDAITPFVREHLPGARLVVSNILLKDPATRSSAVVLHQDFAIVDEASGIRSLQLWIPFVDVLDVEFGGIAFVPGSHRVPNPYRAQGDATPFSRFVSRLGERVVRPSLHAGEAVCFWGSTVHGSPPNLSPASRAALACMLIPSEAQLVHYVRQAPTEVEMWTMSDEDIRNMLPGKPPAEGRPVRRIVHADPTLDDTGFHAWCASLK